MMGMVKAVNVVVLAGHQQDMVLMAALLAMVMLLLMGLSGARLALQGERGARGLRDRDVAMQAAQDALLDGERELAGGGSEPGRNAVLAAGVDYAAGCGASATDLGLCAVDADETPAWQQVDIADGGAASRSVPFGRYTGAEMETGAGFLPFRKPRYVIEQLPLPAGATAGTAHLYRVTAVGFGARESTQVVLQSVYRPPSGPGGGAAPAPAGVAAKGARVAWREIANYRELRRIVKP